MNLFDLVFRPHLEEKTERADICEAANILQVGEFQLLQLAYYEWYGHDMPEHLLGRMFRCHILSDSVPFWARHYARKVLNSEREGRLDDQHPRFHRFDARYARETPRSVLEFWVTACLVVAVLAGSIVVADLSAKDPVSMLPPYFERASLPAGE